MRPSYEDGLIIECVATDWAKAKAKYRYGCDANGNGVIDDGENTKDVNVQIDNDGVCTRKEFPFECDKAPPVDGDDDEEEASGSGDNITDCADSCYVKCGLDLALWSR